MKFLHALAWPAIVLTLSTNNKAFAQTVDVNRFADSLRVEIEAAVNTSDLKQIDAAVALIERARSASPHASILTHYHAYALYRGGSIAMGRVSTAAARPYLERARNILEQLVNEETIPESYALLSAVYGLQIAVSRVPAIAGMQLGSKSKNWMERAMKTAPQNPRVLLLQGIGDFNTPSSFGGGMAKAEQHLKQAISLFANDHPTPPMPAWGLADAHIWLGQVYAKQKRVDAARTEYQAALVLQPQNDWITKVLVPGLDKIQNK